ncbi:MAG: DUF1275 domain-containing protein [Clostridia bacterium]|nr:DUF1275 domain-containing protein [Clostridia bacterium]
MNKNGSIQIKETRLHHSVAVIGGFMGIYAVLLRGALGSSATSNLLLVTEAFLKWDLKNFLLYGGAILCLIAGISLATMGKHICKRVDFRWAVLAVQAVACVGLALIPQNAPALPALYPLFFATAMQWVAFSSAAGFQSSTVFSTNNLRQAVSGVVEYACTRDHAHMKRARFFGGSLLSYFIGSLLGFGAIRLAGAYGILFCLIPVLASGFFLRRVKQ